MTNLPEILTPDDFHVKILKEGEIMYKDTYGDLFDKKLREDRKAELTHALKVAITNNTRSAENTEKQRKFRQEKAEDQIRLKELSSLLDIQLNQLYEKMLAEAKLTDAKTAIDNNAKDLLEFKKLSDEHYAIYSKTRKLTPIYGKLFKELSLAYPEFLLYTPTEVFFGSQLPFSKLNPKQRAILKERLKAEKALENENFRKKYMKFFTELIDQMDDFDDMLYVLKKHPEKILSLSNEAKRTLKNNIYLSIKFLQTAPGILQYMTSSQIKTIADFRPSAIGSAIYRCPKALDNIYPTFFQDYNPKLVFSQVSKHEVKEALGDYISHFPELEAYLDARVAYDCRNV